MFLWQREETCDEASGCVHHENAPTFIDFNEKSLELLKSCYFLACNLAPSLPLGNRTLYIPLTSSLPCCGAAKHPPTGAGLGGAKLSKSRDAKGRQAGSLTIREKASSPSHKVTSQIAETTNAHFTSRANKGACPGAHRVASHFVTSEMQHRTIKL